MERDELRRLAEGPTPSEEPEGVGVVRLALQCEGDGQIVLDRAKDVLLRVLQHGSERWPSPEEWRAILPDWFTAQSVDEVSPEEAERQVAHWRGLTPKDRARAAAEEPWSLSSWLYWMSPEMREWHWWRSILATPSFVYVDVEVESWPFASGALNWLFRASGARQIRQE